MVSSEEVFDFYLHIQRRPADVNYHLYIDCDATNTVIIHQPRDYRPPNDQLVGYQIRVPALMQVNAGAALAQGINATVQRFFEINYRPQLPGHLIVWPYFRHIYFMGTRALQPDGMNPRRYFCSHPRSMSNIYPAFRRIVVNKPGAQGQPTPLRQMVLGVYYARIPTSDQLWKANPRRFRRQRTYSRDLLDDPDSYYSWDITEEFIDANSDPKLFFNHRSDMLQSTGRIDHTVALYVCRGARLMVNDEWHNAFDTHGHHCRSLYQQGSLVIVTGQFHANYSTQQVDGYNDIFKIWPNFVNQDLRPQATARREKDDWERVLERDQGDSAIASLDRFVIFLGATESMHNSVCWKLNVCLDKNVPNRHSGYNFLLVPEGGTIVDICSWNAGFELIKARHRWETLYESVTVSPTPVSLPFQVPDDPYIQRRVLGIPLQGTDSWGPMHIQWPYEELNYDRRFYDRDVVNDLGVRRFLAQKAFVEARPWLKNIEYPRTLPLFIDHVRGPCPPFVPPLLPPYSNLSVVEEDLEKGREEGREPRLFYLDAHDKVTKVGHNFYEIASQPGKRYALKYREDATGYLWKVLNLQAVEELEAIGGIGGPMVDLYFRWDWVRLGVDLRWYVKWPEPEFKMDLICLVPVPIDVGEMNVQELFNQEI